MLCREVIEAAYRRLRLLDARDGADIAQLEIGMAALNGLYGGFIGSGMFGRFSDRTTGAGEGGVRYRHDGPDAAQITVDSGPDEDGALPRNRSVSTLSAPLTGDTAALLYDAALGRWVQLSDLGYDDHAPLSNMGSGLACCLAELLADETGGVVGPFTARDAARFRTALALGFDSPRQAVPTEFY